MIKVLCHNCCPTVPKGMAQVEADFGGGYGLIAQAIHHHLMYCGKSPDFKCVKCGWFPKLGSLIPMEDLLDEFGYCPVCKEKLKLAE